MIITLLFICQVGGEWVQISQQHYRKPYRPTQFLPASEKVTEIYEDDITSKNNRIYNNQSLPTYVWKESDKMYPKGTVIRVQNNNEHMKKPDIHQDNDNSASTPIFTKHRNDNSKNTDQQKFGFIIEEDQEDDISDLYNFKFTHSANEESYEKHFSNNEDVTTEKYQHSIKFDKFNSHEFKHHQPSGTESSESEDEFVNSFHTFRKMGNIKRVQLDSRTVRTPIIKTKSKDENISKFVTESTKVINNTSLDATNEHKVIKGVVNKIPAIKANFTKGLHKVNGNSFSADNTDHENIKQLLEHNSMKDVKSPLFVTKHEIIDDQEATVTSEATPIVNDENSKPLWKDTSKVPSSTSNNADEHNNDSVNDDLTNENKVNAMENVVNFMKTVADTISRNTRRSVNSKVRYLQNLQDTILANIKHRIDTAWPDDVLDGEPHRRVARGAEHVANARGHVEFPSSESALMTISFLTFAVYLIKLILQLIHAYKNKTMMVSPAVIATVGRTAAYVHRSSNSN